MYCRNYTGTISCVLCREVIILCPYLGESIIAGFTVHRYCISCFLSKESLHPTLKKKIHLSNLIKVDQMSSQLERLLSRT